MVKLWEVEKDVMKCVSHDKITWKLDALYASGDKNVVLHKWITSIIFHNKLRNLLIVFFW